MLLLLLLLRAVLSSKPRRSTSLNDTEPRFSFAHKQSSGRPANRQTRTSRARGREREVIFQKAPRDRHSPIPETQATGTPGGRPVHGMVLRGRGAEPLAFDRQSPPTLLRYYIWTERGRGG